MRSGFKWGRCYKKIDNFFSICQHELAGGMCTKKYGCKSYGKSGKSGKNICLDKKTNRDIIKNMKKHFLLALIILIISSGYASALNATESIEFFYDGLEHDSEGTTEELLDDLRKIYLCDIGCSRNECKEILEENGWMCSSENPDVIYFDNENGWEYDGKRITCLFYLFDEEDGRMYQCGAVFEDYQTYDLMLTYFAVHYGFGVDYTMRGFPGTQAFYSFQHGMHIIATPTSSEKGNFVCINVMEMPNLDR